MSIWHNADAEQFLCAALLFLTNEGHVARDDIVIGIGEALLFAVEVAADGKNVGVRALQYAAVVGLALAAAIGNYGDLLTQMSPNLGANAGCLIHKKSP